MNIPTKMVGVQLLGHGDFDQLRYNENIDTPTPQKDEVLIKIGAAGVNNTDINTRIGWYAKSNTGNVEDIDTTEGEEINGDWSESGLQFPRIQGIDACGKIVAVGDDALKDRIGQRVLVEPCIRNGKHSEFSKAGFFGSECDGGFAQFATINAKHAYPINSELNNAELATFPCSWSTAENMLERSRVGQNDTVLVTGASGGVGSATIQLAKRRGAKIIAVSSESKAAELKAQGATQVIDRNKNLSEQLQNESIDVVIDLVAGDQWPALLDALKKGGRYAVAGAIGGPLVELDVRTLYLKDLTFYGCTVLEPNVFKNLISYIENKEITPILSKTYPLKDIVTAQQDFMQKKHVGKLVLIPPPL